MDIQATVAEGAKNRSRVKWWEEGGGGGRSTRYFYQLEKIHGKDQLWDKIIDQDENILQGTDYVQKVQVRFYKDLYASQELENYGMTEHNFLSAASRQLVLERYVTFDLTAGWQHHVKTREWYLDFTPFWGHLAS